MATFERGGSIVIGNAGNVKERTGVIAIGVESPPGIQKTGIIAIGNLASSGIERGGTLIANTTFGGGTADSWEHILQRTGTIIRNATIVSGAGALTSGGAPAPGGAVPGRHGGRRGRGARQPTSDPHGWR